MGYAPQLLRSWSQVAARTQPRRSPARPFGAQELPDDASEDRALVARGLRSRPNSDRRRRGCPGGDGALGGGRGRRRRGASGCAHRGPPRSRGVARARGRPAAPRPGLAPLLAKPGGHRPPDPCRVDRGRSRRALVAGAERVPRGRRRDHHLRLRGRGPAHELAPRAVLGSPHRCRRRRARVSQLLHPREARARGASRRELPGRGGGAARPLRRSRRDAAAPGGLARREPRARAQRRSARGAAARRALRRQARVPRALARGRRSHLLLRGPGGRRARRLRARRERRARGAPAQRRRRAAGKSRRRARAPRRDRRAAPPGGRAAQRAPRPRAPERSRVRPRRPLPPSRSRSSRRRSASRCSAA